jgi:hypothetical protein
LLSSPNPALLNPDHRLLSFCGGKFPASASHSIVFLQVRRIVLATQVLFLSPGSFLDPESQCASQSLSHPRSSNLCPVQFFMSTNLTPETLLPSIPSPEAVTISTFASPRPAPPPVVVPLFSTTVRLRRGTSLLIHKNLDPKPLLYWPYPQTKQPEPLKAPAPVTASSISPDPEPGSPLTPINEEHSPDAVLGHVEPQVILVPPPSGSLIFSKLGLEDSLAKDYRVSCFHSFACICLAHDCLANCQKGDSGPEDGYTILLV